MFDFTGHRSRHDGPDDAARPLGGGSRGGNDARSHRCRPVTATADRLQRIRTTRLAVVTASIAKAREAQQRAARADLEGTAIHPERVAHALDRVADRNAIVVGENWRGREASGTFIDYGFREDERMWVENGGRALGWGIGAAIGAKLGAPNRQVILTIGDGAVMYSAPGLWTMARYGVPVLVVVSNNRYYQTVRGAFAGYNGRMRWGRC